MRILENDILLKIMLLFIPMLWLLIMNIYFFIRRKHSFVIYGMHLASFFLGTYLFSLLMQTAILEIPIESVYKGLGQIALILFFIHLVVIVIALVYHFIKDHKPIVVSPDLESVFMAIEDLTIICDYSGNIININLEGAYKNIFGINCRTLEDMKKTLLQLTPDANHEEIELRLQCANEPHQFEVNILSTKSCFLVTSSPIIVSNETMGAVIVFHSIQWEKELIEQNNLQNQMLESSNNKLVDYVNIAHVLETEKECLKHLQLLQTDLIGSIENVIKEIKDIQKKQLNLGEGSMDDIELLAQELNSIFKAIRLSIKKIEYKKGIIHD